MREYEENAVEWSGMELDETKGLFSVFLRRFVSFRAV